MTSQTVDGKKIYTITDAGRQELEAQSQRAQEFGGHGPFGWGGHHGRGGPFGREAQPELAALRQEGMELARLTMASVMAAGGDPDRLRAVAAGTIDAAVSTSDVAVRPEFKLKTLAVASEALPQFVRQCIITRGDLIRTKRPLLVILWQRRTTARQSSSERSRRPWRSTSTSCAGCAICWRKTAAWRRSSIRRQ